MIKIMIRNYIGDPEEITEEGVIKLPQDDSDVYIYGLKCDLKPYDMEKWRNGKIYQCRNLKTAVGFLDSCDIEFTDESMNTFTYCDWYEITKVYVIDPSEDNLIVFNISIDRCSAD